MSIILRYMNNFIPKPVSGLALMLFLAAGPVSGQEPDVESGAGERPLTMAKAEALALEGNRTLAASRERSRAARARADASEAFLLPGVGLDAGYTRSDDPVAVFGTKLRQGVFREADLALDRLNHPDFIDDWTGAVGARWTALDVGLWARRDAAHSGARASALGVQRTREAVVYRTRLLYLQSVRADARLGAALRAEEAARTTRDMMRSRRNEGLLTDADLLQAEAALADASARHVAAEQAVADARDLLALHLGLEEGVVPVASDTAWTLPGVETEGDPNLIRRADLRASRAGVEAVEARTREAKAGRLPSVETFARLSTHAPEIFDDREEDLTLGVQLSVPLFTGGRLGAAVSEAEAMERAARIEHEDRLRTARADLARARRAVKAADRGVEAAEAAHTAAAEAHRLMRRRFQEGLATTDELLRAEARAARLATAAVDARARHQQARATLLFQRGDAHLSDSTASGPESSGPYSPNDHRELHER